MEAILFSASSCIHIPVEVFQSSEAYLGPCQKSGMKHFAKVINSFYPLFLQKCSIEDLRMGSKYASRFVPLYSPGIIRILA